MSEPVKGEPSELSQMVDAVEARNGVMSRLASGVDKLTREVGSLRRELDTRPTGEVVAHRRRRTAAAIAVLGFALVWGTDAHIENCSPGKQAADILEFATDRALKTPNAEPMPPGEIRKLVDDTQPTTQCDVSYPLHHHGSERPDYHLGPFHLSGWNLVGFAGYVLVGGILWWWQRPRRRIDRKEPS